MVKASPWVVGEAAPAESPAAPSQTTSAMAGVSMQWNWGSANGSAAHLQGQEEHK